MYDIWTWCLEEGFNLYIEKPMGSTIHQARSLFHLAEKHGSITQVGHQRRSALIQFDNGSTGYVVNSWSSGRRVFRVQIHAPGIYTDAEVEGKAYLCADGDYEGVEFDTRQVADSDEPYVYGGFREKNRERIGSIKAGNELTSSPFRDCVKTMEVAETILAKALINGE